MIDAQQSAISADAVVVGGGPAGASIAHHLASQGVDVAVLERATYPRDKICGDGLTPAAVAELAYLGIDTSTWNRNRGLTVIGGGHTLHLRWPEQTTLPGYGMTRARMQLDHDLINHAERTGARVYTGLTVTGAITDGSGRVVGVQAKHSPAAHVRGSSQHCAPASRTPAPPQENSRKEAATMASEVIARAKVVIDAGGVSARLATSLGLSSIQNRPMGVAARTYFHSPRGNEQWMESHLELWSGKPGQSELLPGYGWIFPMGDGLVNVGLGSVASSAKATALPYKKVFNQWVSNLPEAWGFTPENQVGKLRSAALPMCFNRKPHYAKGLVLVGDAGGMVSPFNGEGIAPALKAGRFAAAAIAQGLKRTSQNGFDLAMKAYEQDLKAEYGGYYTLGRIFVHLIENPRVMHWCTSQGLQMPRLMTLVHKLLSDGYARRGGDAGDRLISYLTKVVPAA